MPTLAEDVAIAGQRLKDEASTLLHNNKFIIPDDITINSDGATITLSGSVGTESEKMRAEDLVRNMPGVNNVNNQLQVTAQRRRAGSAILGSPLVRRIGIGAAAGLLAGSLYLIIRRVLPRKNMYNRLRQRLMFR